MKKPIILVLFFPIFYLGCQCGLGDYVYNAPEKINDGLEVGNLSEVNIDTSLISDAVKRIAAGCFKEIHSLLIFKDNKLVLEEYFPGHQYQWDGLGHHGAWVDWDKDKLHHVQSVTKSFTSGCIGIAIDQGFIENANQSIFDYLPNHQQFNTGGKNKITIEHLLTMTSGLEGNEWTLPYSYLENPIIALWLPPCEDPVSCILEKPLSHEPGTHFSYFGGHQILLGEILKYASGLTIDEFSKKYLFEKLQVDTVEWAVRFDNGVFEAAGGLKLTPRAMLKMGIAYLNNGKWQGAQIASENWVEKSATTYPGNEDIDVPGTDTRKSGYSYSWWTEGFSIDGRKIDAYHAGGWGGQKIMVISDLNTVIVFTGGTYTSKTKETKVLKKYILPAII